MRTAAQPLEAEKFFFRVIPPNQDVQKTSYRQTENEEGNEKRSRHDLISWAGIAAGLRERRNRMAAAINAIILDLGIIRST